MKNNKFLAFLLSFLIVGFAKVTFAQYDDLYYEPDTDDGYYDASSYDTEDSYATDEYQVKDSDSYDNDDYDYFNDYNYYYSSRIRRFNRPIYGSSFYDPFYVDSYYYNPASYLGRSSSGLTLLIYDNNFGPSYGFGSPYNRFNSFNSPFYDPFYSPFSPRYSSLSFYGGSPFYGGSRFYGGSPFFSGLGPCISYGNGFSYPTVNTVTTNNYYGPRRVGSSPTNNNRVGRRGFTNSKPAVGNASPGKVTSASTARTAETRKAVGGSNADSGAFDSGRTRNLRNSGNDRISKKSTASRTQQATKEYRTSSTPSTQTSKKRRGFFSRAFGNGDSQRSRGYENSDRSSRSRGYDSSSRSSRNGNTRSFNNSRSSRSSSGSYNRTRSYSSPRSFNRGNSGSSPRSFNRGSSGSSRSSGSFNRGSSTRSSSGSSRGGSSFKGRNNN